MKNQSLKSKIIFSLLLFTSLLPLAFSFAGDEVKLLIDTPYQHIISSLQAITLLVIIFSRQKLSKNQAVGVALLYMLIPFAFTFGGNSFSFLVLRHYANSLLSWAIAIVVFIKMAFHPDVSKNING